MIRLLLRLIGFGSLGVLIYLWLKDISPQTMRIALLFWGAAGAKYFARDIIEIIPAISRAGRRSAHEKWHGRYYTFHGAQIRLCLVEGKVWIVEADVRAILSPAANEREQRLMGPEYALIDGTGLMGYSATGLLRLIDVRLMRRGGKADMKKFRHWLEAEAIPNLKRFPSSSTV